MPLRGVLVGSLSREGTYIAEVLVHRLSYAYLYARTLDAGNENVSYAKCAALCSCTLDFCCDIANRRISSLASGVISFSSASLCAVVTSFISASLCGWMASTASENRTLDWSLGSLASMSSVGRTSKHKYRGSTYDLCFCRDRHQEGT